jgi:hypothetical protein
MPTRKTGDAALARLLQVEAISGDCFQRVRDQLREMVARLGTQGTLRLPSEAELSG